MKSKSGSDYLDMLKAKNRPKAQISEEDMERLSDMISRLEDITEEIKTAAETQIQAAKTSIELITEKSIERVGKASALGSFRVKMRDILNDILWILRLIAMAVPTVLVLALWAYVGLR